MSALAEMDVMLNRMKDDLDAMSRAWFAESPTIGRLWEFLDFYEERGRAPVPTSIVRAITGVSRTRLRFWEREGRLDVYYVVDGKGTRQKAYRRPRGIDGRHEIISE